LKPDTEIIRKEKPGYKGYTDDADAQCLLALAVVGDDLPPMLSEGWINDRLLSKIHGKGVKAVGADLSFMNATNPPRELLLLTVQEDWHSQKAGEITVNGVRIIKYNSINYFNIEDLQAAGVID